MSFGRGRNCQADIREAMTRACAQRWHDPLIGLQAYPPGNYTDVLDTASDGGSTSIERLQSPSRRTTRHGTE